MKTIIRNFMFVLRRFKMAMLLNVFGLSIAYAAFMIIMMQVSYDNHFDSCQPNAASIFRMDRSGWGGSSAVSSRPLERTARELSPHIKYGVVLSSWGNNTFFSVEHNGEKANYKEQFKAATLDLPHVFDFDFTEGDANALSAPNSVIIPESFARKYFGNEPALGKALLNPDNGETYRTIGGVYKDFPRNSSLTNIIYERMSDSENYDQWGNQNYQIFYRLDDPANVDITKSNIKKNITAERVFNTEDDLQWDKNGVDLTFTPLSELHFLGKVDYDPFPKASRQTIIVLISIALVILIIAGINFTNFSTALTPMRIKSINTQKVLGSPDTLLRGSLLLEAIGISLLSYLLSLGLLHIANITTVASLVEVDLSFAQQPFIIAGMAGVAVLVGLLAGLYPSYYITSFPPALVLKGSFGLSPKGRHLRSALVSVQFIASFALIIGSLFMYLQNYYMQHTPLGYDKDEMIVVHINQKINDRRDAFVSQLKTFSGISDATYAHSLLASGDTYMGWGFKMNNKNINFQCIPVSSSFLRVMGIDVLEGRDFRPEDDINGGYYIFNRKAVEQYDIKLGDKINGDEVIGFVPNIKFASLRTEVSPMAFYIWGKSMWRDANVPVFFSVAYVKVKAGSDLRAAMEHVRSTLKKFDPAYPFDVKFYDEVLQSTYEKEQKISSLITLFSLIAVFISIVGVFGLVVFDSEYRRKEIGVRKVLGSTTGQILIMFNKTYLRILVICFVLAAPIAAYAISGWLENFAYRIPMYWWVYAIAFVLILIITVATVTFQNWHAANSNPVNSIKSE
ncbi:ABC transporter permease [Parabacteroides chinchillae]